MVSDSKVRKISSQEKFLKKQFGELHKEEVMAKSIHKPYPVPKTKSRVLKAQDLDSEVVDLLSEKDQRSVKMRITLCKGCKRS